MYILICAAFKHIVESCMNRCPKGDLCSIILIQICPSELNEYDSELILKKVKMMILMVTVFLV